MRQVVSVIVPVLNEGGVIGVLLEALQPLRAAGNELIVVDGGSRDDTCRRCHGLVDRLLESAPGRAVQMNAGAAVTRGDWLWFVHADSRLQASVLDYAQAVVDSPQPWGRFDVSLDGEEPVLRLVETGMNWRSRLTGIATGDQGIFVRRDLFRQVGGYPTLPLMEDIALSSSLREIARPATPRLRLGTSARRWQRHGVCRTIFLMWRLRLAFFFGADPADLARDYRACNSPTPES